AQGRLGQRRRLPDRGGEPDRRRPRRRGQDVLALGRRLPDSERHHAGRLHARLGGEHAVKRARRLCGLIAAGAALVACAGALAAGGGPAPAFAGKNGLIAFTSTESRRVSTVKPDGTGLTTL